MMIKVIQPILKENEESCRHMRQRSPKLENCKVAVVAKMKIG